jgi:hypothetical protein
LTDITLALQLVSHDRPPGIPRAMDSSERTEIERTRRIRRIAVISVITLVILVLIAVGIYVIAFVISSPMIG